MGSPGDFWLTVVEIDDMERAAYIIHMLAIKKIATNIPRNLIKEATQVTGLNQTQTLIAGLRELIASKKRHRLLELRGKLHIAVDTDRTRRRRRS